jgi:hypothetical protein
VFYNNNGDFEKAVYHYLKSAKMGNCNAILKLSKSYYNCDKYKLILNNNKMFDQYEFLEIFLKIFENKKKYINYLNVNFKKFDKNSFVRYYQFLNDTNKTKICDFFEKKRLINSKNNVNVVKCSSIIVCIVI